MFVVWTCADLLSGIRATPRFEKYTIWMITLAASGARYAFFNGITFDSPLIAAFACLGRAISNTCLCLRSCHGVIVDGYAALIGEDWWSSSCEIVRNCIDYVADDDRLTDLNDKSHSRF